MNGGVTLSPGTHVTKQEKLEWQKSGRCTPVGTFAHFALQPTRRRVLRHASVLRKQGS